MRNNVTQISQAGVRPRHSQLAHNGNIKYRMRIKQVYSRANNTKNI